MAGSRQPDPFTLFAFAVREHDWVLADEIARRLLPKRGGPAKLRRELERSGAVGAPQSVRSLRRLACVTQDLGLDGD